MRTPDGCQAMVQVMVTGARLAGGLTPDRAETLLTIMLEHSYFNGLDEADLRDMLEQACRRPPQSLGEQASQLDDAALAFQFMVLVVNAEGTHEEHLFLDSARQLEISQDDAAALLAAGTPPELDILNAEEVLEEVYLDVLLAAAAADGRIAPEELDKLVSFACSRLEFRLLPRTEIEDVMEASLQGFLDHGFESWMETLTLALPMVEQRQTAYQLAQEMIAADHEITTEELSFMRSLASALNLPG